MEHRSFCHLGTVVHIELCMPGVVKVRGRCVKSMWTEMFLKFFLKIIF